MPQYRAAVRERQVAAVWIALALVAGLAAVVLDPGPAEPFGREDAVACASSSADRLGYPVGPPTATERGGSWEVVAAGDGVVLRLVVRAADERITDVAVMRAGGADVLTRDERLVVLEAGCG